MRCRVGSVRASARNATRSRSRSAFSGTGRSGIGVGAARQDGRQVRRDQAVVRARLAAQDEAVDREHERRVAGRPGQRQLDGVGRPVAVGELQREGPRVGQQAIAVHRDAVALAQEAELARLVGGARHLRQPDGLERLDDGRHRAAEAGARGEPGQQPGAAAPARDDADADLDQAAVRLDVRLDRVAVQQDLAAAAERAARRCADDRERRPLERRVRALARAHRQVERIPRGDVRGQQHGAEVRADREVLALVVHHQRAEVRRDAPDRLDDQRHGVRVEGVDVAGELQARHAVAGVPERRGGVADDRLAILLDVAQAAARAASGPAGGRRARTARAPSRSPPPWRCRPPRPWRRPGRGARRRPASPRGRPRRTAAASGERPGLPRGR